MARPLANSRLVYADLTQANTGPPALFAHYDKVFGAMYGQHFDLDESNHTIQELLQDVVGIIDVAKYLGCMKTVAQSINAALLGQGQVLWRSVQANPFAWVDLAFRVRSTAVFAEAVIHLVGRWNSLKPEEVNSLDPAVRKFCEEKHHELQMRCIQVECRIVKFYPNELTRPIGAPTKHIQRMSYANDIYTWMALCLLRHWFASVVVVDQHRHAVDGGWWFYSRLAKAGNAYLDKIEVNKFHGKFPMSTRGEHVLDQTVNRIKEMIRPIVADLMRSEANLDQERFPVEYLTCAIIKKDEVQGLMEKDDKKVPDWGKGEDAKSTGEKRRQNYRDQERELERQLMSGDDGMGFTGAEMATTKRPKKSDDVASRGDGYGDPEDEIDDLDVGEYDSEELYANGEEDN